MRKKRTESSARGTSPRGVRRLVMAVLALALLAHPCAAEEPRSEATEAQMAGARELVAEVIERYESENSYRIDFTQESYWALADTTLSSSGVLLLERPTMLSVRYDDGSTITSNGDTLWVYMSETNQYFVTDIGEDDTVIDPPRVLRSYVPDPEGPFSDEIVGRISPGTHTSHEIVQRTLLLIPADGSGEPSRLEVTVDPSKSIVTGMAAHTRSGDSTRYRITKTTFGVETAPSDFVFTVPPGAERMGG